MKIITCVGRRPQEPGSTDLTSSKALMEPVELLFKFKFISVSSFFTEPIYQDSKMISDCDIHIEKRKF